MSSFVLFWFAMAVGFTAAGLVGSFYQVVTNRPMSFELFGLSRPHVMIGVMGLVLAGPAVIMRNAIRGRLIERRPGHWLALSTAISATWSFLSGVFILNLYIALRAAGYVG
jgi:hypothetical protein